MKNILRMASVMVMGIATVTHGKDSNPPANVQAMPAMATAKQNMTLKIRLTANEKTVVATLADNPSSRDFHSLLPLTLTLDDYAATEKIAYLPRKLARDGAPAGMAPAIGDIAYYAPWGNLAIFYKGFGYSTGLIKLGTMDAGLESLVVSGPVKVRIEPVAE